MTSTQKVIKYCALAFAFAIIANIIFAILFGIGQLSSVLGITKDKDLKNMEVVKTTTNNITSLEIDLNTVGLEIKSGNIFSVETNSKKVKVQEKGTELNIKEKSHTWHTPAEQGQVKITIPKNSVFIDVKIETGAGKIVIEKLSTSMLDLDIGAGKVDIKNLIVTNEAEIDGGAGKVDIKASTINNLDLDMGVGKCSLTTILTGNNQIDAGVGALDIKLLDTKDNYNIQLEKGIGSITLNGEQVKENIVYGRGNTGLRVKGGIGAVKVKTTN